MARGKKLYEGKAKIVYQGSEPNTIIQYFKDDATAFNAEKKAVFENKGVLNNLICEHIMVGLNALGIETHFLRRINAREQLCHKVEIIPLEVIVRNRSAGSFAARLGIEEGVMLPRPLLEFCYKDDALGDPLVSEEHIDVMEWAARGEMDKMIHVALRVNDYLMGMMYSIGISLIDFKLEFGRKYDMDGQLAILLADEISPDTCRLWDMETSRRLDKDVFRRDLGDLGDAYRELARRLNILPRGAAGVSAPKLVV